MGCYEGHATGKYQGEIAKQYDTFFNGQLVPQPCQCRQENNTGRQSGNTVTGRIMAFGEQALTRAFHHNGGDRFYGDPAERNPIFPRTGCWSITPSGI